MSYGMIFVALATHDDHELLLDDIEYAHLARMIWLYGDTGITGNELRTEMYDYLTNHGLYHEHNFVEKVLHELHIPY